ncbi:MAG: hypothetical protein ABIO51_00965 [Solirubrobacteraceae bacterium]
MSFRRLKWASLTHSIAYAALLASWATTWQTGETVFGYAHGIGWFVMCGLAIAGLRRGVIPLYVAVCVAVIGAVGPFVGTASFIVEERRRQRGIVQGS